VSYEISNSEPFCAYNALTVALNTTAPKPKTPIELARIIFKISNFCCFLLAVATSGFVANKRRLTVKNERTLFQNLFHRDGFLSIM
jgi:hypothetical protein